MAGVVRPAVLAACSILAAGAMLTGCAGGTAKAGGNPGDGGTPGASPAGTPPSDAKSPAGNGGGPVAVEMTVSGTVTGQLRSPVKGPKYSCGTPDFPDLWGLSDVEGDIDGVPYYLQISINNFTGTGKQTGPIITVGRIGSDPGKYFMNSHPATVVMSDRRSGTFEGDLQQTLGEASPAIHVKGSFRC